jgi:hypothetical protein
MMPTSFDPVRPGGGTVTAIWQYRCDCFRLGGGHGLIDMNVATHLGHREMWAPR